MRNEIAERTLLSSDRLAVISHCIDMITRNKVPGATAELGVYRGGVSKMIATAMPERSHYCFDTFSGIPNADPTIDGHSNGDFSADLADVKAFLHEPNIVFCVGLFPQTTQTIPDEKYALVHIDADTYASTRAALEYFYCRTSPGGFLIIDDYDWRHCLGVKKAVSEFLSDKNETADSTAQQQVVIAKLPQTEEQCGTLLIAHDGQADIDGFATKLGDSICAIINARAWAEQYKPKKLLLSLCSGHIWNPLWSKFIADYDVEVIYNKPDTNSAAKYARLDRIRASREINGRAFDVYRELYARLDGGHRQNALCAYERGLGRTHVFDYFHWGQELPVLPNNKWVIDSSVIHVPAVIREPRVLIAPLAIGQGNSTFTHKFWKAVYTALGRCGIRAVWNFDVAPADIAGHVAKNSLLCCGNTGIGWVAAVTDTPFIACEPHDSYMYEYRYELFKPKSLVDVIDEPDVDRMVAAIRVAMHFLTPNVFNPALSVLRANEAARSNYTAIPGYKQENKPGDHPDKSLRTFLAEYCSAASPQRYLEIGTREGDSLRIVIANSARLNSVVCADTWGFEWGGSGRVGHAHIDALIAACNYTGDVQYLDGDSKQTIPTLTPTNLFDLILVDGDHSAPGAIADLDNVLPLLAENGCLVFHDITHPQHLYLDAVWDEWCVKNCRLFATTTKIEFGHGLGVAIRNAVPIV